MSEAADPVPTPKPQAYRTWSETWPQLFVGFGLSLELAI